MGEIVVIAEEVQSLAVGLEESWHVSVDELSPVPQEYVRPLLRLPTGGLQGPGDGKVELVLQSSYRRSGRPVERVEMESRSP